MRSVFFLIISGVRLSPLGTAVTSGLLYKPQTIDEGDSYHSFSGDSL
jgi:hypothetical protein